ncbi:TIR domain-containing protein [Mycobacterium colombiense]
MARSIFASFHYDADSWRVQQVLKMGAIEGDSLVTAQEWESVKRKTNEAIEKWIHDQMLRKSAVVVLVGAQTASRSWVEYEIRKAWTDRRPLVGVRIHGLKGSDQRPSRPGANPFSNVKLMDGRNLATLVPLYEPAGYDSQGVYNSIATNMDRWIGSAVTRS